MFVILLGPPGAGKGTQASLLAGRLGVPTISTGELFRREIAQDTPLGREVAGYINRGQLVPDETTLGVLSRRLEQPDAADGAVLDGFPRTIKQAEALDELLRSKGENVERVIDIEVPRDVLERRLAGRWTCRNCHATYHESSSPPQTPGECDRCGGELYQRPDDAPEAVRTRLRTYEERTAPLIDYYRRAGLLATVDGTPDRETVTRSLIDVLDGVERRA